MLRAFLSANREAILARSREKVRARPAPAATEEELEKGIPLLLDQLIGAFRDLDGLPVVRGLPPGRELTDLGVRVVQIVHDYERVLQAVVEVAEEAKTPIDVAELRRLHRCLDEAVSQAVTEYSRRRERTISEQETERLGILAHESRNALSAAMLAFQALQAGKVAIGGSTAGLLDRSLRRLSALVETSIAQVRIEAEALFRPFEQRGVNRAGLGLSISRRSVEADAGTLAVQDIPGTGCVFTVELPRLSAGI